MKQKELGLKIFYRVLTGMFSVVFCVLPVVAETIDPADIDWLAVFGTGDYSRAAYTEMIAKCTTVGDGSYPDITDSQRFYACVNGIFFPMSCAVGMEFNDACKCCDYPSGNTPSYMKKCSSVSHSGTFCNCADNPNGSMRGGGTKCSCNSNGIGINYSNCTATPQCQEIKDTTGKNQATMDIYGACYVPTGATFSDSGGLFEFSSPCYYKY